MLPKTWGEAILALIGQAQIPEARLATAVGVNRAITYRHLRGQRPPSAEMVRLLNNAVAELTGVWECGEYLNAVYEAESGIRTDDPSSSVLVGFAAALVVVERYLRDKQAEEIVEVILRWPKDRRDRLVHAINVTWHRWLIRNIAGDVEKTTRFDEIRALCLSHGLDLTPWLRPEEDVMVIRRQDEFRLALRHALAGVDDLILRNNVERSVMAAFKSYEAAMGRKLESITLLDAWSPRARRRVLSKPKVRKEK